ncbi:hypothetical protein RFI_25807 [Reticulomyxa filosa]|uniref:Reverse transcriptase domain-containing protein n=1 Tax=Reticulomyxa filosa TaxID=46433 RepID=X6MCH5_RETFI|nr:hypothetical protein RFI_25807 [Reticulomyxa filosa]|eukprot:ETO11569.1 hypothetical protein RFI_25807 [Reticulomyxa filosa]
MDKNAVTYAVLMDISAAYDIVWRDGLRFKMRTQFNIKGRLYWWIDNFLRDRVGQVVLNGTTSSIQKFEIGLPQGSAISPVLFLLYINDITELVQDPMQCGMFADDVALWTSIYKPDIKEMEIQLKLLQQSLDEINSWGSKWKMLLALEKSQSITFRSKNKKNYPHLKIHLDGLLIKEEKQVKYLGLIMDSNLTYKQHVANTKILLLERKIKDSDIPDWIEIEHPIKDTITNIRCKIECLKKAIEYSIEKKRHKYQKQFLKKLITGKVGLNQYMHIIKKTDVPECRCPYKKLSLLKHFLIKCTYYEPIRKIWYSSINLLLPELKERNLKLIELLIGLTTWKPDIRLKVVQEVVKFVVASKRNI